MGHKRPKNDEISALFIQFTTFPWPFLSDLRHKNLKMNDCGWFSEEAQLEISTAKSGAPNEGITELWLSSCDDREDSGRLWHPPRGGN